MPTRSVLSDVMKMKFPEGACVDNLCDCGFHKKLAPPKTTLRIPRSKFETNTNYSNTYKPSMGARPRSSKRPPPSARNPQPPAMSFSTNQRSDFQPHPGAERVKPMKKEEKYEAPTQPVETETSNQKDFPPKQPFAEIVCVKRPTTNVHVEHEAKFGNKSTNQEHFQHWDSKPMLSFRELPSLTGSIIYPGRAAMPESTAQGSYLGTYADPPPIGKPHADNIKTEGEMTHSTTNRHFFKPTGTVQRVQAAPPKSQMMGRRIQGKFSGVTQNMSDYGGFKGGQPRPPRAAEPPRPTLTLELDSSHNLMTEQRAIYKGFDPKEHPVPDSYRPKFSEYTIPEVSVETVTSNRAHFRPVDMKACKPDPVVTHQNIEMPGGKFDATTTNNEFFKNWEIPSRVRYGDFHESHKYIPSMLPFHGESTTRRTYTPKAAQETENYKPSVKPMKKEGEHVFETEYRTTFMKKKRDICPAHAFLLQQTMKGNQQKHEVGVN